MMMGSQDQSGQQPAADPAALLQQAQDLIAQALAALGAEEQVEPQDDSMSVQQAFASPFNEGA